MFWRKRKTSFIQAAIQSLLGQQMNPPSYSAEAARSMAHIALVMAACIGFKFPSKVPSIYTQEFGKKRPRIYGEMADAINKWADAESTPLSDLAELPILKTPYHNRLRLGERDDKQDVLHWAVIAFRYGCVLGASQPDLFRDLWNNQQRRERRTIQAMRTANFSVADDVESYLDSNFDEFIDEPAGFLEYYESNISPLPTG